jgi:hypothetical protein
MADIRRKEREEFGGVTTMRLLRLAREQGATSPVFAETTHDKVVILDIDSGKTWAVELREF